MRTCQASLFCFPTVIYSIMSSSSAIVTTLRDANSVLEYFISYHLSIGFDRIYLFFDDPTDPGIQISRSYSQVIVQVNDRALHTKWEKTRIYQANAAYHAFIDIEVMARQILNAEVAMQLAQSEGITWLLHIDIDELFYTSAKDVKEHFRESTAKGVDTIVYFNHEAVVELLEIKNYFESVTLFKKNRVLLSKDQIQFICAQKAFLWGQQYFLYYSNGKSAVKVSENAVPSSVHTFTGQFSKNATDAFILHYPVCGFTHFWKKYKLLGAFPDQWFGYIPIEESVPFHIQARNVVQTGNWQVMLQFYRQQVMVEDTSLITEALREKVFFRK